MFYGEHNVLVKSEAEHLEVQQLLKAILFKLVFQPKTP